MTSPKPDLPPPPASRRRWSTRTKIILVLVGLLVVIGGLLVGRALWWSLRPTPDFPSLADDPDPELQGTVAFVRPYPDDNCIAVVAASGGAPEEVACVEGSAGGLTWLPDGRLQATRYEGGEGTGETASWIVDVETGDVEEVPVDEIPPEPASQETTPGPGGEVVRCDSTRGALTLTMTTDGDSRTLLSTGAPDTYCMGQPVWNGDGTWFVVKDDLDRLLLVTTGEPSTTRLLVDGGWGQAVTDQDLVAAEP
jgi:hypothetical protein